MPVTPTYPGIYIQEAPSSTHTIIASPTNIAVFIGYTHPLKTDPNNFGKAVQIFGFMDYQRRFGGFVRSSAFATQAGINYSGGLTPVGDMAQAVNQFFLNGGATAYIVALTNTMLPSTGATLTLGGITFTALEITDESYGMSVSIRPITNNTSPPSSSSLADVIITYGQTANGQIINGPGTVTEVYRRVSLSQSLPGTSSPPLTPPEPDPNYILTRIGTTSNPVSALVTVGSSLPSSFPTSFVNMQAFPAITLSTGSSSSAPFTATNSFFSPTDFTTVLEEDTDLDKTPVVNLIVLPGISETSVLSAAITFCERKMAFLIMDPPINNTADGGNRIQDTANGDLPRSKNAALYFPYLLSPDPITGSPYSPVGNNVLAEIPPAPTVAGIYAATDLSRGVWKAPAGYQALTNNTTGVAPSGRMTDQRQGILNQISVNCLRDFPSVGTVVFGARTLASTYDQQWTYVPVRRMALFLEQTLAANLKWVIFEPNAQQLWSAITISINAFMLGLFKQGAFQGTTPSDAFLVQCDNQTTTQADIDSGIVNIVVGFAPLVPAEFVIITIAQLAGQATTG